MRLFSSFTSTGSLLNSSRNRFVSPPPAEAIAGADVSAGINKTAPFRPFLAVPRAAVSFRERCVTGTQSSS
jgi:hypothetical protein